MRSNLLITGLAAALGVLSAPAVTQAATVNSSPIAITLPVNAPTCTVINNNPTISLQAASVGQTVASYQATYLPITSAVGDANFKTSTTLNQTATISCSFANTAISGFMVKPGPGATVAGTISNNAAQFLVDATTPTPAKIGTAANGYFNVIAEQLSVNGSPAIFSYRDSSNNAALYTTTFSTGVLGTGSPAVSTANVVWRPIFYSPANNTDTFGTPTGGSYKGVFEIRVDY